MNAADHPLPIADDPHGADALRLAMARQDVPWVLVTAGFLVVLFSVGAYVWDASGGVVAHVFDISMGLACIVVGALLRRSALPDVAFPRIFATMATLLVLAFLVEIWRAPYPLAMTYVLLIMCAFGTPTLAWRPYMVAGTVMVVSSSLVALTWAGTEWLDWTIASLVAITIGTVLLSARMRSVALLADVTAQVRRLATTDEMTGLLNRHGLVLQVTPLVANAERFYQGVFVVFVDIDGLKSANDRYGHEFGDDVIRSVSRALVTTVREGDIVARWGGDELIVVGLGDAPKTQTLDERLRAAIRATDIDLGRWPGTVSFGLAQAESTRIDIDDLIRTADEDMYNRRMAR